MTGIKLFRQRSDATCETCKKTIPAGRLHVSIKYPPDQWDGGWIEKYHIDCYPGGIKGVKAAQRAEAKARREAKFRREHPGILGRLLRLLGR